MKNLSNKWPKHISVDKRIVKILSESTYESFPNALKEIITNSYDADASLVDIKVDFKNEIIEITDNGKGMSESEFEFFTRIAGVKRQKEGGTTASGRYIIGKFGVGFLSIFPFFKNYKIETTKKGSREILTASIPCYQYFSSGQLLEVSDIPIQGEMNYDIRKSNQSFTTIVLTGFTTIAKEYFKSNKSLKHRQYSIHSFDGINRLRWRLAEDLPITFEDNRFNSLTNFYSPNLKFEVYLNKVKLLRTTFANDILEINDKELSFENVYQGTSLSVNGDVVEIGKIKFQYFILTNKIALHPYEARGLKIRNLNAGVGAREAFGLGSEMKGGRSRLQWLTGEILVIEGLNDIISVSRDRFYYDPDYEEFKDFFVKRLSHHSNQLEEEADYIREESDSKIKNLSLLNAENDVSNKISKTIKIKEKEYNVKVSQWNFKDDFYPACKIENDNLIINKNYPLFKKIKHTDVFIKLHLLFLSNLKDGTINKSTFEKITKQIMELYKDYI